MKQDSRVKVFLPKTNELKKRKHRWKQSRHLEIEKGQVIDETEIIVQETRVTDNAIEVEGSKAEQKSSPKGPLIHSQRIFMPP
jgi:hypothetical protein